MSAPYTTYTQEQLLLLLAQSDEAAFAEIYNRYWERLYVIAYNRLAEKETAEDAVHDVFTGLWQNRGKAEIQELENYLAVAVKFNVLAKIKKLCNQRNALKSNQGGYYVEANVDELIDNKRLLQQVYREIEKLPSKCRVVFKKSRIELKPVKNIAEELSLSNKTVENHITNAIRQLKLSLKGFL